jgi:hypothetical protein
LDARRFSERSPERTSSRRRSPERALPERISAIRSPERTLPTRKSPERELSIRRSSERNFPRRKSRDDLSLEDKSEPGVKYHGFVKDLSGQDAKYCACLVEAGVKNKGKYNPYAVCSKSTGGHVKACGRYYDYEIMPLEYLLYLADKYGANVEDRNSRESVIHAIMDKKEEMPDI